MYQASAEWLIGRDSRRQSLDAVIAELAKQLIAAGVPLWRLRVTVLAMHPEVFGRSMSWSRTGDVRLDLATVNTFASPAYRGSPVQAIHEGLARVHVKLVPGPLPYPQLVELRELGGTEYAAFALELGEGRRTFISIATDAEGGFTADQLTAFEALLPALTIRLELESTRFSAETLLQLYLGKNAAARVLQGDFRRGTGQRIDSAIWLCDLRGFTALTDRLPVTQVVPVLDAYFEVMARPVAAHGGEILKFIGDSILAVFPTQNDVAAACRRAVKSAVESIQAFEHSAPAKEHGLRVGVAVNVGEVMYGNIGATDRLDFTVIGAAVNEAARMESLCKALRTPLLLSEVVARHLATEELVPLGSHALRGVTSDRTLFTLTQFAPHSPPP